MPDPSADRDSFQALLEFHVEAGVDVALDERPHDRFAEALSPTAQGVPAPQPREQPNRAPAPRPLPRAAAGAPVDAAGLAREQAKQAQSLMELEAILLGFE